MLRQRPTPFCGTRGYGFSQLLAVAGRALSRRINDALRWRGCDDQRVITPTDLARGGAVAELEDLPRLAQEWIAAHVSCDEVLWLASLGPRDAAALPLSVIRTVLRAAGADVPPDSELADQVDRALSIVQRDLDSTGFGQFRFHAQHTDDWSDGLRTTFWAALDNGQYDHNAGALDPTGDPVELLRHAGHAVAETILAICSLAWPDCPDHNGPQLQPQNRPDDSPTSSVWWRCASGNHYVAPLGELLPEHVRPLPSSAPHQRP